MASNEKDAELDIEIGVNWKSNMMKSGLRLVYDDGVELLVIDKSSQGEEDRGDRMADVEKICVVGEKHKKSAWKPPKPPRPPNGPSILDAADRKLVRELAELATRKRERVERIRALKKMKATKPSSGNNSSVSAMFITVIFFLVIAFQGLSARSSAIVMLHGSAEPAVVAREGLISVQHYKESFAFKSKGPGSGLLSFAEEQVSHSGPGVVVRKQAR